MKCEKNNSDRQQVLDLDDEFEQCRVILTCVTQKLKVSNVSVQIEDLMAHNPLLQEIVLKEIFSMKNNIEKINQTEKKSISKCFK